MGEAIGQMLPFAVGIMVSPMPVVAMVLMLVTPQARANGIAFVLGWIFGIGLAGAILLLLAGPADVGGDGEPGVWVDWLKLLLGCCSCCWPSGSGRADRTPTPTYACRSGSAHSTRSRR
jgi:hypothetical protein